MKVNNPDAVLQVFFVLESLLKVIRMCWASDGPNSFYEFLASLMIANEHRVENILNKNIQFHVYLSVAFHRCFNEEY